MAPEFVPGLGAEAWQLSNPPIFAMTPLRESLAIFDRVGMHALRAKSLRLHAYTRFLVEKVGEERFKGNLSIVTPRADDAHGCQLSIRVKPGAANSAKQIQQALMGKGVVADFREPDIVRIAPVPLYNTFADCLRFARTLSETA
jgi:kynureninase